MNILDQIHLEEIKLNSKHLQEMNNPSVELLEAAIDYNPNNIDYINDPSEELQIRALELFLDDMCLISSEDKLSRGS